MHKTKVTSIYQNREAAAEESSQHSNHHHHHLISFPLAGWISLKTETAVSWLCFSFLHQVLTVLFSVQQNTAIQRHSKTCSYPTSNRSSLLHSPPWPPKQHYTKLQPVPPFFRHIWTYFAILVSGQQAKSVPDAIKGINMMQAFKIAINKTFR